MSLHLVWICERAVRTQMHRCEKRISSMRPQLATATCLASSSSSSIISIGNAASIPHVGRKPLCETLLDRARWFLELAYEFQPRTHWHRHLLQECEHLDHRMCSERTRSSDVHLANVRVQEQQLLSLGSASVSTQRWSVACRRTREARCDGGDEGWHCWA